MAYKTITPQGNFKTWEFKDETTIEGKLVSKKNVTLKDKTSHNVYEIETANGIFSVWEKAGLRPLQKVKVGTNLKIEYKGMVQVETPKGKVSKHDFQIDIDENAELDEIDIQEN